MKKNFYIFLDFDGIMANWQNKNSVAACYVFKPESVKALNYLIENLEQKYNVNIVITSALRHNMTRAEQLLKINKVNTNCFVDRTGFNYYPENKCREICDYLKNKNENKNYVIIDDQPIDYPMFFNKNKIIKTQVDKKTLNIQVKKFLDVMIENTFEQFL